MPVKSIGNKTVVETGFFTIGPDNPPVTISISNLDFTLVFAVPNASDKPIIQPSKTGDTTLTLTFLGWDSALGISAEIKVGNGISLIW
jgi:hypothetical protein